MLSSLVVRQSELWTVRQGGPDGPPLGLEIRPETSLSLVDWRRCVADSPLLRRGQSASQSRNSSRDVVGSGELAEVYCGQSATGSRTVRRIVVSLSRDVGRSGRSASLS